MNKSSDNDKKTDGKDSPYQTSETYASTDWGLSTIPWIHWNPSYRYDL